MADADKKRSPLTLIGLIAILMAAGALALVYFQDTTPPSAVLTPAQGPVGKNTTFSLSLADQGSGLKSVRVTATKGNDTVTLADKAYSPAAQGDALTFTLADVPFRDGEMSILIQATDASFYNLGKGSSSAATYTLRLDTKAPRVSIRSGQHNVRRGGAGCVTYTVSETPMRTGVQVGEMFFPAYEQANGEYACLFAFPYDMEVADFAPRVLASDEAGNERSAGFNVHPIDRKFRHDVLNLPDSFLERKSVDFENAFPGDMTPLDRYLKVNRDMRTANRQALISMGTRTSPAPLWAGSFVRMAGASRAGFGDQRTYKYKGQDVDHQTHLGADIASIRQAKVPAANNGDVVFADDLGIYGQCVILDHGLGLMTLYAHLSEMHVQVGDRVERGQIVGRSGTTGLAGGDHLHFGVLVAGLPVTPVEWWDARWIKHNISDRLSLPE